MILWTGLISRSEICNLCPSCCLRSYNVKVRGSLMYLKASLKKQKVGGSVDIEDILPQSRCLCTPRRCAQIWACFGSKPHTCSVSVPGWRRKVWKEGGELIQKQEPERGLLTCLRKSGPS